MPKYNFPILAKPSGITLDQHKLNVMSEGMLLLENMPFVTEKYQEVVGKSLLRRLVLVSEYHDDGKAIEQWQGACQKDYELFLKWKISHNGTYREFAQENPGEAGKYIRKAGIRHELQSLVLTTKKGMPPSLQAAIAAHHSKLGFNFEQRWIDEGLSELWNKFQRESNDKNENLDLEQLAKVQYEYAGPRGLLQFSDHRASAKEEEEFTPNLTLFKYDFPHPSKRGVQIMIEENWQNDLLLVRAPTGAGKTDASLLWASLQIKNKRADRVIIAMPTRFTSNALSISVAESLSNTGLYHSSAWFSKFQSQIKDGEIEKREAEKVHELARLLQNPVTVCTIDHLLMSLTLTREDHHLITFNLANSCLVIDEADFYDEFTQSNILVLLEILKYWKVPILLMSASLPESTISDYQKIGYSVNEILEDKSDYKRERFEIIELRKYEQPSEIDDLLYLMIERGNGIIYANTVDKAVIFYKWFMDYNNKSVDQINVVLYHSRFTEPDKARKEKEIITLLGREAWENNIANGIVIMTQIGEMSINISAEMMISDICPIDRLTQRAGRMCRFDKTKSGKLFVLLPQKRDCLYPAPYGSYDSKLKSWISCNSLDKTISLLRVKSYNAEMLVKLLNEVYNEERGYSAKAISNANNLKGYYKANWLLNPKQKSAEDDNDVNFWKSRDIIPQDTVFVKRPDSTSYLSYSEFQAWKISNSVELPIYLIEKGQKQHKIDSVSIRVKNETIGIYVIREGFYDEVLGAVFLDESNSVDDRIL